LRIAWLGAQDRDRVPETRRRQGGHRRRADAVAPGFRSRAPISRRNDARRPIRLCRTRTVSVSEPHNINGLARACSAAPTALSVTVRDTEMAPDRFKDFWRG